MDKLKEDTIIDDDLEKIITDDSEDDFEEDDLEIGGLELDPDLDTIPIYESKSRKSKKRKKTKAPKEKRIREKEKNPGILICTVAFLLAIIGAGVYFLVLNPETSYFRFGNTTENGEEFFRELADFDALLARTESFDRPETFNRALDRLQRRALGVESHLSILKRRRLLAKQDSRFIPAYQRSAQLASRNLPLSEALSAIAIEATLMSDFTENESLLREYSSRINYEIRLKPVVLGLHIILGDFGDPFKADAIPNKNSLYSAIVPEKIPSQRNLDLIIDLILLQALHGNVYGAAVEIDALSKNEELVSQNQSIVQFVAEFLYDENPLKAAEFFARFTDENSMARQADALWRAAYVDRARDIWTLLISAEQAGNEKYGFSPIIYARSLYNLAATSENIDEKRTYLRPFLNRGLSKITNAREYAYYTYGVIAYSRLLPAFQAVSILESELVDKNALLEIELIRRQIESWSLNKTISETWIMLNRHNEDTRAYQWAGYFFDFQGRFEETDILVREASRHNITGAWLDLHEVLHALHAGDFMLAEERLRAMVYYIWQVPANIGRVMELAHHDPMSAIAYYERALELVKDKRTILTLYFRISQCFRMIGNMEESRKVLERILELDPEYFDALLELQRLR